MELPDPTATVLDAALRGTKAQSIDARTLEVRELATIAVAALRVDRFYLVRADLARTLAALPEPTRTTVCDALPPLVRQALVIDTMRRHLQADRDALYGTAGERRLHAGG